MVPGVCSVVSVGTAVVAGALGSSGTGSVAACGSTVGSASTAGSACGSAWSSSAGRAKSDKMYHNCCRLAEMRSCFCYLPTSSSSLNMI